MENITVKEANTTRILLDSIGILAEIMLSKEKGKDIHEGVIDKRNELNTGIAFGMLIKNGYKVNHNGYSYTVDFRKEYHNMKTKILNGTCLIHSKEVLIRKIDEAFSLGAEAFIYKLKDTYTLQDTIVDICSHYGKEGYDIRFNHYRDEFIIMKRRDATCAE